MTMRQEKADLAVVGAGILGLAHAYAAAKRGGSVVVFERSPRAAGASVRNFGMIWPVGQPMGPMHDMAMHSRKLWKEVLEASGIPYFPTGSLHLAYRSDEMEVGREFAELAPAAGHPCTWLNPLSPFLRNRKRCILTDCLAGCGARAR